MMDHLTLQAVKNFPIINSGDDLVSIICDNLNENGLHLIEGDILVIAQKIVSKSQNLFVDLRNVSPSKKARELAQKVDKDPRLIEVILSESRSIIRQAPGVLITEHKSGCIMANAGIDSSNIDQNGSENNKVLLLPRYPDDTCQLYARELQNKLGVNIGVIMNDSFGRPWRYGAIGVAIGAAGLPSLWDRRGERDLYGKVLRVTQQAPADELASAASLLQGQGAEGVPLVLVRGYTFDPINAPVRPAAHLIRDESEDLFR